MQVITGQTSTGELGKDTAAKTEEDAFTVGSCDGYQYAIICPVPQILAYLWRPDLSIVHSARLA